MNHGNTTVKDANSASTKKVYLQRNRFFEKAPQVFLFPAE